MNREEFETQKFSSAEHKRIHPFDVFALLQKEQITDVIRRGREKVTVAAEGHKPYSYWATVMEINGQLYTETTTVEPNTAEGIAMMLEFFEHAQAAEGHGEIFRVRDQPSIAVRLSDEQYPARSRRDPLQSQLRTLG